MAPVGLQGGAGVQESQAQEQSGNFSPAHQATGRGGGCRRSFLETLQQGDLVGGHVEVLEGGGVPGEGREARCTPLSGPGPHFHVSLPELEPL